MKSISTSLLSVLLLFSFNIFAQAPIANFNVPTGCVGATVNFTDLSSNTPTTWYWQFGDGATSTNQNEVHVYSAPGVYNVTLIVANASGDDTLINNINIYPTPTITVGSDPVICSGASTTISASGGLVYNWSPSTGLSSTTVSSPIASPTSTTTYTVMVSDANGCSANDMINVTVNPLPIINYTSHTKCEDSSGFATVNLTTMDNYISDGLGIVDWYTDAGYSNLITDPSSFYTDSTILYTKIVANGCFNTNIVEINIPINDIIVSPTPVDAICNGSCDGSITLTPSGGNIPYNYSWTPGGMTTQNLNNLCAGTYTYTIIDASGCILFDDVIVNNPTSLSIILAPYNISCFDANDGFINSTINGGTLPYNYSWNTGATTQNINGLDSGTYNLTIIDANGCTAFDMATISEPLPNSIINGTIYYQTVPVTAGIAELIRQDGVLPGDMTVVDITAVNPVDGIFRFDEVEAGNYIIKVLGDTSIYNCASTYSVSTTQWQLAQDYTITSSCNDSLYLDIDLIELPSNSGPGTINGRLVQSGGGFFNKAPGDPIPDIDITVEQSPGGGIMSATTTDVDGYFSFTDLPLGTYIIRADMFGYGMDTLQTITFNGTNDSYNVTLCSNDTINMVDMCKMNITGVNEVMTNNLFSIYPNPAKDFLNITNNSDGNIKVEITDLMGKRVFTNTLQNNFETIDISTFKQGIYIITLSNTNIKSIHKLIVN